MLNIGGGEVIVILLVALIVLGPAKLPDAVREVGKAMGEFRKLSAGFREEFADVLDDQTEEQARARGKATIGPASVDPPSDITPEEAPDVSNDPADDESAGPDETA